VKYFKLKSKLTIADKGNKGTEKVEGLCGVGFGVNQKNIFWLRWAKFLEDKELIQTPFVVYK